MAPLRSLLFSVLFISLSICQCGSIIHKKVEVVPVWSKGDAYIQLFREEGSSRGFDQPWTFYETEMREILLSLYYSKYQYFRWSTSSRRMEKVYYLKFKLFFILFEWSIFNFTNMSMTWRSEAQNASSFPLC